MAGPHRNRNPHPNETLLPPASELASVSFATPSEEQFPQSTATIPAPPPSSTREEAPHSMVRTLRSPPPPAAWDDEPSTDRHPTSTLPPPPSR